MKMIRIGSTWINPEKVEVVRTRPSDANHHDIEVFTASGKYSVLTIPTEEKHQALLDTVMQLEWSRTP